MNSAGKYKLCKLIQHKLINSTLNKACLKEIITTAGISTVSASQSSIYKNQTPKYQIVQDTPKSNTTTLSPNRQMVQDTPNSNKATISTQPRHRFSSVAHVISDSESDNEFLEDQNNFLDC